VICTSHAVKDNVQRVLQAQAEYLKDRLGAQRVVLPRLPVIPLGIHTADFVFSAQQRQEARQALGVAEGALVVLFMGRLSFHAKAHPLAMYQALEQAAKRTGKTVVLVECGWHANESIRQSFESAQQAVCPSVRCITLDGREAAARQQAWASADVACSLSDNIQETFGITPIEAMAAGLPLVVSDWDGYKDTVRDGVDGFRIPTLMPQAGLGGDLAHRHALEIDTYDMYCGHTCSLVAVDVQAAAAVFEKLFNSPELRHQMGEAGRKRAVQVYDWKTIIGQYETLWAKQTEMRLAARAQAEQHSSENIHGVKPLAHPWPARMDPFHAFASYPTHCLTPQTLLALVDTDANAAIQRALAYRQLAMVDFAKAILPSEAEISAVLMSQNQNPMTAKPRAAIEWVQAIPEARRTFVFRALAWLVKLGLLKVVAPSETEVTNS
jgi:glycosyltransferase involved in cell wall biosynthesis